MLFSRFIQNELYVYKNPFIGLRLSSCKCQSLDVETCVRVYIMYIHGFELLCVFVDKSIRMGTIGVYEGEIITLAFEFATKRRLPVICIVSSGGMRVHDGTLALMQMAKISLAVKRHGDKGLLYMAIVTNPTLGGASASFVSLADVIIAEDNAVYGFTGRRIIQNTIQKQLPEDFQSADYAKRYGQVDIVVPEEDIEDIVRWLLRLHG